MDMKTQLVDSVLEIFKSKIKENLMEEIEASFENQIFNSEVIIAGIVERSLDKSGMLLNDKDVERIIEDRYSDVITRDDMAGIKDDIEDWRISQHDKLEDLRSDYDDKIAELEDEVADLKSEVSEMKDLLDRILHPDAPRPASTKVQSA
jgi:hypothetical protein